MRLFVDFGHITDVTCSGNFLKSLFLVCFTRIIIIVVIIYGDLAESLKNHL